MGFSIHLSTITGESVALEVMYLSVRDLIQVDLKDQCYLLNIESKEGSTSRLVKTNESTCVVLVQRVVAKLRLKLGENAKTFFSKRVRTIPDLP